MQAHKRPANNNLVREAALGTRVGKGGKSSSHGSAAPLARPRTAPSRSPHGAPRSDPGLRARPGLRVRPVPARRLRPLTSPKSRQAEDAPPSAFPAQPPISPAHSRLTQLSRLACRIVAHAAALAPFYLASCRDTPFELLIRTMKGNAIPHRCPLQTRPQIPPDRLHRALAIPLRVVEVRRKANPRAV